MRVIDENTPTLTNPAAAVALEEFRGDDTTYTLANGVVLPNGGQTKALRVLLRIVS